ncbi:MAG: hypothetical protein RL518_2549 [Pseudomonadota bacterium]
MNRSRYSLPFHALLIASASLLVSEELAINPAHAQTSQDGAGATTVSSSQKVNIIMDRERTPEKTVLLLKILVPQDAKVESFALENPARIVVDFHGVSIKTSENLVPPKNSVIKMIRLGAHADKLRIVMDLLTPTPPQYEWRGAARQATLRIVESGATAVSAPAPTAPQPEPTKAATAVPTPPPPTQTPTTKPTLPPTPAPTAIPTKAATLAPTTAPTAAPTIAPTTAPTTAPTSVPTAPPTVEQRATATEPKLPDMTDKELEEALDQEVARASAALERGEELPELEGVEGEDLVDVPSEELEDADLSQEKEPAGQVPAPTNKAAGIVAKDLPTGATGQPAAQPDTLTGLRANPIPAAPVTDFTIQRAEFAFLEPEHKEAFRIAVSQGGAQARMSKVDPTTYKVIIPKCGIANLGLALPQYPPADYKGILAATPKVEGDSVEITIQVEEGVSLTTLIRDKEVWIKRQ